MNNPLYKNQNKGFTLVELIVSIGLFSIVMTMGVSALLTLISSHSRAQSAQIVTSNLSFAIDTMTRNIRTGFKYHCVDLGGVGDTAMLPDGPDDLTDCPGGADGLVFTDSDPVERVAYRHNTGTQSIERKVEDGDWLEITSGETDITRLDFYVTGAEVGGDDIQPRVMILLEGVIDASVGDGSAFRIQTTVTQRRLDL